MTTTTPSFIEEMEQQRRQGVDNQRSVNAAAAAHQPPGIVRASAAIYAYGQLASYPQYDGHFDGYTTLVRFRRAIKTKMGTAFEKGDYAIAGPVEQDGKYSPGPDYRTVYSLRNRIDTTVPVSSYEVIPR